MAYPSPYGAQYPAPHGYYQPPRRKRGIKRTVFGGLGLIANAIGLVVMPILAGIIGAAIAGVGATDLEPVDPRGGTFTASSWSAYSLAVPADEAGSVTCDISGRDVEVSPSSTEVSYGNVDGVEYVDAYDITAFGDQEVTVECEGASAAAVSEMGMVGILVSLGIGLLLPVVLGLASLVLLIWGIIALIRS